MATPNDDAFLQSVIEVLVKLESEKADGAQTPDNVEVAQRIVRAVKNVAFDCVHMEAGKIARAGVNNGWNQALDAVVRVLDAGIEVEDVSGVPLVSLIERVPELTRDTLRRKLKTHFLDMKRASDEQGDA